MGAKPAKANDPAVKREKKISDALDHQIWKDKEKDAELIKLLLLGAGESGKSTLFKQMMILYGSGFSAKDFKLNIPMIHNNTIQAMKELCFQTDQLGLPLQTDEAKAAKRYVEDELKAEDILVPESVKHFRALWKDPAIKATWEQRSKFQIMDTSDYFFEHVERLAQPDFLPIEEDLIRCRIRTTGIVENHFSIDGNKFLMVDVGGQRNERKKWIHCFEGVTAVIYVCAISAYDQVLYEDGKTNRMKESLALFAETCMSKWFTKTSFILFLNKRDLFDIKIKKVPITVCFDNYDGSNPNDYNEVIDFIQRQYEERYHQEKLYVHVTCATDTNNIAAVFGAVKDIIIQKHLAESGLI